MIASKAKRDHREITERSHREHASIVWQTPHLISPPRLKLYNVIPRVGWGPSAPVVTTLSGPICFERGLRCLLGPAASAPSPPKPRPAAIQKMQKGHDVQRPPSLSPALQKARPSHGLHQIQRGHDVQSPLCTCAGHQTQPPQPSRPQNPGIPEKVTMYNAHSVPAPLPLRLSLAFAVLAFQLRFAAAPRRSRCARPTLYLHQAADSTPTAIAPRSPDNGWQSQ